MKLIKISSVLILKNVSGERYRYMFKTSGTGALRGQNLTIIGENFRGFIKEVDLELFSHLPCKILPRYIAAM